MATIRSQNVIELALPSSGIKATLLDQTAHSTMKLPFIMQINKTPTCNLSRNSAMAKVWQQNKFLVWDECTMAQKKSLEALDCMLQDLRKNTTSNTMINDSQRT